MTKFARTFITTLIVLGGSNIAHAADDTFTTTLNIEVTASAQATYASLKKQSKITCRQEAKRSGFSLRDMPQAQMRKCEKQILNKAIKQINNRMLTAHHNKETGTTGQAQLFAQN